MRKKSLIVLTVGLTVLLFIAVGSLTAADAPETIIMNSNLYKKHMKGLVGFSHKKHADHKDIGCADCHHVYKDGKNIWKEGESVQKCGECHKETGKVPPEMKKADKIKSFHKEAIHENCKGCHKKMIDKNSELAKKINKCDGCHPKKK